MKKSIIAAIVGGIILFLWQFVSWTASGLHQSTQQYTAQQDVILRSLSEAGLKEGGYIVPNVPANTPMEEATKIGESWAGKPWASVQYHNAMEMSMGLNMVRGIIANIVALILLCWIVLRLDDKSFTKIITASLFVGLIGFLTGPYSSFIWYKIFDIWGYFADAVVPWLLIGAWLGWYLKDRKSASVAYERRDMENA